MLCLTGMKCSNCGNEMIESRTGWLCVSCGHAQLASPTDERALPKIVHDRIRPRIPDPAGVAGQSAGPGAPAPDIRLHVPTEPTAALAPAPAPASVPLPVAPPALAAPLAAPA